MYFVTGYHIVVGILRNTNYIVSARYGKVWCVSSSSFCYCKTGDGSAPNGAGNGLLAYASAWLVALLHAVEVSYVRRFFQVVVSGRDLERRIGLQLYFSRYDQPEGWPLRLIYFFAVAVLLVVALARLWSLSAVVPFRPVVIAVAIVAPFVPLVFSVGRAREYFDQHFRPGGRNEGVSPETT